MVKASLDGVIPAARASWLAGGIAVQATVFRGPAWPAGVDVLAVRLEETAGQAVSAVLALVLSTGASVGERAVSLGGRTIIALPAEPRVRGEPRDWGFVDEATAMPGWASPASGFDPAFSNIRAGLGGVPISYRFRVEPKGGADVVLGFCESHWSSPCSRSMTCKVEGAPHAQVDPLALFGRHQPGGLLFAGTDENGDGFLDVLVIPGPGSPDRNPILNAIWLLPQGLEVDPAQVIQGTLNALALRRVDVGGAEDQALYASRDLEFPVTLEPGGSAELAFLVACPGGEAPVPERSTWTAESLRSAARAVWEDWRRP